MISGTTTFSRRAGALLLIGTVLSGTASPLLAAPAQQPAADAQPAATQPAPAQAAPAEVAPAAPAQGTIHTITVKGTQRLEPETIRAYANLAIGQTYTRTTLDQAVKDLYATGLFADANITGTETGDLVINVRENPVINRIVLEGNKRLKDDKIMPEIKEAPRQIFTRPGARADVDRILELYRRQGRFAARVDPEDRPARPEPRRRHFRDPRGRPRKGPGDQHPRKQGFSGWAAPQGDVHTPGRRSSSASSSRTIPTIQTDSLPTNRSSAPSI